MPVVRHHTVSVDGLDVFYREAGPADAPVLLLLHGYPTSSHMFRHLIPALADRNRVIAPDHIGFGRSSAPSVDDFAYTFAALADMTRTFLETIGVARFTVYVQDYGAPIAWRLALADPAAIEGIISQNGNAYEEGFVSEFWEPIWAYGADPSDENEQALRPALAREAVEWQYTHGVADIATVDPDAWEHDLNLLGRPGVAARSSTSSVTTPRTGRSTTPSTNGCDRRKSLSSQSGAARTRSSPQQAQRPFSPMFLTRGSNSSTEGTSCSNPTSTTSWPSCASGRALHRPRASLDQSSQRCRRAAVTCAIWKSK